MSSEKHGAGGAHPMQQTSSMDCLLRDRLAADYADFCRQALREASCAAAEPDLPTPPAVAELQCSWMSGELGCSGESERHGNVRIIDFGEWNRREGPDFLRAELELDGRRLRGDIVLTRRAEDWESAGYGADPRCDGVVLHVVAEPPPAGWYTRNSRHEEIPVLALDPAELRRVLGYPRRWSVEELETEPAPLRRLTAGQLRALLLGAAARRMQQRRELFQRRVERMGESQSRYECWAETLGYRVNKLPMRMLARRAPLRELGDNAHAILFGTAGFLEPVLPERAGDEARRYHRSVWDAWWPLRETYGLSPSRRLPWVFSSVRPLNHPHRRVAALAASAAQWSELRPLMLARHAPELLKRLSSLRHPFWSRHCNLQAEPLSADFALVGKERAKDFIVNHVCVCDDSEESWRMYLKLRVHTVSARVSSAARRLLGERADLPELLTDCYVQQALLQLDDDFGRAEPNNSGEYPELLGRWSRSI